MTGIVILCAGKLKEQFYRDGVKEYEKRLGRYVKLFITEVQDGPDMDHEAERMLPKLKEDDFVITLEIGGEALDSEGFAELISKLRSTVKSRVVFVIGGSEGLHPDILKRSDMRLSFSRMTFPHNLMRVILLEQIYRAYRIINNEPYHK